MPITRSKLHVKRKRPAKRNHAIVYDARVRLSARSSKYGLRTADTYIGHVLHVTGNDNNAVIHCSELFSEIKERQIMYNLSYGDLYD